MKAEQLESTRLKREVIKLKTERDILPKSRAWFATESTFGFIVKHQGIWPAQWMRETCRRARNAAHYLARQSHC